MTYTKICPFCKGIGHKNEIEVCDDCIKAELHDGYNACIDCNTCEECSGTGRISFKGVAAITIFLWEQEDS